MKLIVGLGNPGKQYEHTRHNAGFFVIDALLNNEVLINKNKLQAEVVKTEIDGKRVLLARPTTFMNLSGVPVQLLLNFFKINTGRSNLSFFPSCSSPMLIPIEHHQISRSWT